MTQAERNELERRLKIVIDRLQMSIATDNEIYLRQLIDKSTNDLEVIQAALKIIDSGIIKKWADQN